MDSKKLREVAKKMEWRIDFCYSLYEYVEFMKEQGELTDRRVSVVDEETLQKSMQFLLDTSKFKEILKYIDLSNISTDGLNLASKDLTDTNIKIDPQKVNTLYHTNLENIDMSDADYNGVCITRANLKNTNSKIDLDNIRGSLEGTNLEGCTCYVTPDKFLDTVIDRDTNFENTTIYSKQKIKK